MAVTHLQDVKWNVHVFYLRVMQFTVSSILLTTGCLPCSFNKRNVMLEYLCLLQDWYCYHLEQAFIVAHTDRDFNCPQCQHSSDLQENIMGWKRVWWWGLQGEHNPPPPPTPPPPPLTVCHDWWLWATPKCPPPLNPPITMVTDLL